MNEYCIQHEKLKKAFINKDPDLAILYKILYGSEISWEKEIDCDDINNKIQEYLKKHAKVKTVPQSLRLFYGAGFPENALTFNQRVHVIVKQKEIILGQINKEADK